MKRAGWKTRHVFERYNIVRVDDQREAALQTQAYRAVQVARVAAVAKIGDNRPRSSETVDERTRDLTDGYDDDRADFESEGRRFDPCRAHQHRRTSA